MRKQTHDGQVNRYVSSMVLPTPLDDYEFDLYRVGNALRRPGVRRAVDHPSWIGHARRYAGGSGTYVERVTVDEHIATIRGAGGRHRVHSGGHDASVRTQYSYATAGSVAANRTSSTR